MECGLLKQTALRNSFFTLMVPHSSQRRGRALLPALDGVSSCLGSHMVALTDVSWEQRVCAPCMLEGQFSTSAPSAPAAELTAAAAVGLLLEEGNSSVKLRRISWIADSTYALNVTAQRCRVIANTAMANFACGACMVSGTTAVAC